MLVVNFSVGLCCRLCGPVFVVDLTEPLTQLCIMCDAAVQEFEVATAAVMAERDEKEARKVQALLEAEAIKEARRSAASKDRGQVEADAELARALAAEDAAAASKPGKSVVAKGKVTESGWSDGDRSPMPGKTPAPGAAGGAARTKRK